MTATLIWPGTSRWGMMPMDARLEPAAAQEAVSDPDTALVGRCLKGDEAAWEGLVRLHTRRVYAICYRFTGGADSANDLTQEVFLRVFRSLSSYSPESGTFRVWLTRLTRNLLIDHYRKTRKEKVVDSIEDRLPQLEASAAGDARADSRLASREASELLQVALEKLSPDLREAVILRDLEELEYREIADVLNVPEGTVKSRISRGRAELARVLTKSGLRL